MRLAEALAERKALDARLSSIEGRLRANARIQEGDAVSEDPERLFALLDSTAEELRTLMVRIARTNRETVVDGRPLADWIAERDVSVRRFNILSGVQPSFAKITTIYLIIINLYAVFKAK